SRELRVELIRLPVRHLRTFFPDALGEALARLRVERRADLHTLGAVAALGLAESNVGLQRGLQRFPHRREAGFGLGILAHAFSSSVTRRILRPFLERGNGAEGFSACDVQANQTNPRRS